MIVNIGFAFACDKKIKYWKYVATTIVQMISKTSNDNFYNIYVIVDNIVDRELFTKTISNVANRKNFKIMCLVALNEFKTPYFKAWGNGTWYRMEFIKQLPHVDKIAYFDPDVYFNCDVVEYYNIDLKDNYVGGVIDLVVYLILNHSNNKIYAERLSQYDLSTDKNYICAGVTLWNLKLIRQDHMYDKLLKFASENKIHADQNTINFVFKHRILPIPIRYGGSFSLRRCLRWYRQSAHIAYNCTKNDIEIELNNEKINHSIVPKPQKVSWLGAIWKNIHNKPLFLEWKYIYRKISKESKKQQHQLLR